jgi:CheY-like chemotaxis protein
MAPIASPNRQILLVDDDGLTRSALAMVLDADGYAIREAANGEEALRLLAHGPPPCLILLDLIMPVMDGCAFRARQLRDPALADIPVVVFSAAPDVSRRAAALGVAESLQKPIDPELLLDAVRRYCA